MSAVGEDPIPELTTTRTGGRSARVIAVAFAALLIGVVYVGFSGQNKSSGPTAAPVAVVTTPRPTQRTLPKLDTIQSVRANPGAPVLYQYLGARLSLGGQATIAILDQVREDEYRVSYRIPFSLVTSSANLNISTVMDTVSHDDFEVLGSWSFPLTVIDDISPQISVLAERQKPDARTLANPTFTRIARNGFRVAVTWDRGSDVGLLTVAVLVDRDPLPPTQASTSPTFPSEDYAVVARVGGQTFVTDPATVQMLPGHIGGEILMPLSLDARRITVELSAIPSADPLLGRILVASRTIGLPRIADHALTRLFTIPAGQPNPGYPQIVQSGYLLRLVSTFNGEARALFWELVINPTSAGAVETVVHNWVTGDDGLVGWPSSLQNSFTR